MKAANLADKLQRCLMNFFVGHRRIKVKKYFNVSTHTLTVTRAAGRLKYASIATKTRSFYNIYMSESLDLLENNDDGFWDARRRRDFPDRREVLRRLETPGGRTANHVRRNAFTYIMAALAIGGIAATALVVRNARPPDINEYRPERVDERVLTDAAILGHMGLCESELRAEAAYRRAHGEQSPGSLPGTDYQATPARLDRAADLARDNNVGCAPAQNANGLTPGAYRLEIPGGSMIVYPATYTSFVASPAEAACDRLAALEAQQAMSSPPAPLPALDEAIGLQTALVNANNAAC